MAARVACIDQMIESLPQGYETLVGDNGNKLSGGERQRLCLARALAREPAILLLDEATSALDEATELEVHANLACLSSTCIMSGHRLASIKDADRIVVLRDGSIVQDGSYAALAENPGAFRELLLTPTLHHA